MNSNATNLATIARPPQIVNCIAYHKGKRVSDISIESISDVLQKGDDTFVWVGLHEPDQDLLRVIQVEFGLHDLAIEDALSAHQRPKLEEYGDTLFIVLQTAELVDHAVRMGETHIFFGKNFIVSVRHGSSFGYTQVRARCEMMPQRLSRGPGFALYALIDFVVDNYKPIVDSFEKRFSDLEGTILNGTYDRSTIEELYRLKRQMIQLNESVSPLRDICGHLVRFHRHLIPRDISIYFRDIYDHVARIDKRIASISEMLTATLQVNLAMVTVGQNEVVKKLAGWGAILALPTMVFSLYGMNFKHMPELSHPMGYPVILGAVVIGCFVVYRRLKRANWL